MKRKSYLVCIMVFFLFLSSCGTISKPLFRENEGKIDYSILFLDSLGLAFFIVPGVIFLGIDHATGTLYLEKNYNEDPSPNKERINPQIIRELLYNSEDFKNLPKKTQQSIISELDSQT